MCGILLETYILEIGYQIRGVFRPYEVPPPLTYHESHIRGPVTHAPPPFTL